MTTLISEMKIPRPQRDGTGSAASTRLMLPRMEGGESLTKKLLGAQQRNAAPAETGTTDPLLRGLVDRLPKPNGPWALDERAKWLRTAVSIFDLVYESGESEQREISVGFAKRTG
jgi:hypothetical protein